MHPIERLRWIARSEGEEDSAVAAEAAWSLAELAVEEPAAVLTAGRRLVLRQPSCGPLWWACANIIEALGGQDILEVAHRVALELAGEGVSARLAAALRREVASGEALAVTPPVGTTGRALEAGRYAVRLLAPYRELRYEMAHFGSADVTGFELEESQEALEGCRLLLVEPRFASSERLFVSAAAARAVRAAHRVEVVCWAVLGPGRLLSEPLAVAAGQLVRGESEELAASSFAAAVDSEGLAPPTEALGRSSCPAAAELAHLSGLAP